MRKLAILIWLVSAIAFANAQEGLSITGSWKLHQSIAGNDSDSSCTFTQKDNALSGTCDSPQGSAKFSGTLDGKRITWSYASEYNGSPLTLKYDGTFDAGKITGTVTVDPFGVSGDFTATQSPATPATPAQGATPPTATPTAGAPGQSQGIASVAGKWKLHGSVAGNDSDAECTFTQKGTDITGDCVSAQGDMKITGKVDGGKVTFDFDSAYNGNPLTVKYDGTLDGGKITGGITVEQYGVNGDFTATLEK